MTLLIVERLLQYPTVRIQNVAAVTEKMEKILKDGKENVHFISGNDACER